jgi:hypothetical protein
MIENPEGLVEFPAAKITVHVFWYLNITDKGEDIKKPVGSDDASVDESRKSVA